MMLRTAITGVAAHLPPLARTSAEVERMIGVHSPGFRVPPGIVERRTGVRTRRVAAGGVNCSDLAAAAARKVLEQTGTHAREVDLLIFASASQNLIEPATANIVQEKVGTACPVFDLKNGCNSFLNALQVADSLIQAGAHRNVLIAVGEMPSRAINWSVDGRRSLKRSFVGYTVGDAGAAALVAPASGEHGIAHCAFETVSKHWGLATVPAGGTMHGYEAQYRYFQGDGGG